LADVINLKRIRELEIVKDLREQIPRMVMERTDERKIIIQVLVGALADYLARSDPAYDVLTFSKTTIPVVTKELEEMATSTFSMRSTWDKLDD
jgi:hypothetical protein